MTAGVVSLPPMAEASGRNGMKLAGCRRQVQVRSDIIGLTARFNPFQSALVGSELGRFG